MTKLLQVYYFPWIGLQPYCFTKIKFLLGIEIKNEKLQTGEFPKINYNNCKKNRSYPLDVGYHFVPTNMPSQTSSNLKQLNFPKSLVDPPDTSLNINDSYVSKLLYRPDKIHNW